MSSRLVAKMVYFLSEKAEPFFGGFRTIIKLTLHINHRKTIIKNSRNFIA